MYNGWLYSGLKALGSGQKAEFLDSLFNQLYGWTKNVTETYNEFPAGYTEWTLTGHMNIVSYRGGFLPYSDYPVKITSKQGKEVIKSTARPDLHIHSKDWKESCCFELKKDFVSLTTKADLPKHVLPKINEAHGQLKELAGSGEEWAQYGCSTLGLTVWMNWLVGSKDRWEKIWSDSKKYQEDWEMLFSKFESSISENSEKLSSCGRIYYCGYRMSHSLAEKIYQISKKELKQGNPTDKSSLAIGMLWIFTMEPWKTLSEKK
jgi:hypothetical protein